LTDLKTDFFLAKFTNKKLGAKNTQLEIKVEIPLISLIPLFTEISINA
jgi:hypothetical protein